VTYSWSDGTNIVGTDATLDVSIPGTYTVTVTAANGCTDSESIVITQNIIPPTVTCPPDFEVCLEATAFPLTGATPIGGIYSGTGVVGEDFDPSAAGIGAHVITYTYTDVNGCENFCNFTITVSNGVVIVTATLANTGPACYPNLGEAFAAINDGTHQGAVTVSIHDNTSEPSTAILNASGGTASYTSVVVSPAAPGISVTGNLNAPLIQLNGAGNVTFDGRVDAVGASYSLTLNNANAGNLASTIEFAAGAANNLIQFCNITGFNAFYSQGSAGNPNTDNSLLENRIYDFLNPDFASNGIHLAGFNADWTIQGNELYQTTPLVASANVEYAAIRVDAGTGSGFLVENNTIGGNAAAGNETWTKTGSNNVFYGIYIAAGTGTGNIIDGNTISSFEWTNSANANWTGIHVAQGAVNITGNTIGAGTGAGNIQVTLGSTTAASNGIFGISHASGSASTISGNVIGAFTTGNSAANASNIYGIAKLGVPAPLTIENNQVNGLQASSASTGNNQVVYGIAYEIAGGNAVISGNTIQGLSNLTTGAGGQVHGIHSFTQGNQIINNAVSGLSTTSPNISSNIDASVIGIAAHFRAAGQQISGNTIFGLSNSSSARSKAIGIFFDGSQDINNRISENFIHSLSVATVDAGPLFGEIYGIRGNFGGGTFSNNIISLGTGVSSNAYIYGIYDPGNTGSNYNLYHNTIYISGTSSGLQNNSYAFFSSNNANQKNVRNNIFHNARSWSGDISYHSAVHYHQNANGLVSDYNVYYYPSGYFARIGPPTPLILVNTLADWQMSNPGLDQHSVEANSNFAVPGGIVAANYIPGNPYNGFNNTGILTDYNGTLRDCAFTRGAYEAAAGAVTAVFDPVASTRCQGEETITYTATVFNAVTIVYSIDNGLTIDPVTGAVSYPAGWTGDATITVTATGCDGTPVTATHVATTSGNVGIPVFDLGETSVRCVGETPLTVTYTAIAPNSTAITYALSAAGSSTINAATGEVTWDAAFSGIATITATAEGCGDDQIAVHTVTINPSVGTPVFDPGPLHSRCQGEEDVQYTATAANTTGITYSIDAASTAGGVSIDANTGLVSYPATWIGITTITASAAGCNGPAVETFVVETTTALTPSVSIEIDPPGGTCAGGELTFTAIPVHGGPSPSYQWRLNGVDVPGATSEVYGPVILNDGDVVRVTMISSDPCALPDPVFSVVTVSFGIVEVFSVANPSPTCYNTLGEAFTSINNGDYVGQISVRILASTTEPVTAVLNASGGLSSYTSVRVFPQSEGISVTGDIDGPLVHLNGADGVILHGSPGGAGADTSLFYINTRVGPNATTIQLDNGATSNTITYCNLRGSGTGADRGTIYIGGGGANTGNNLTYCSLSGIGDNRPDNSVYSFNPGGSNSGNILNNEFFNFFSLSRNSNGVYLHTGSSPWYVNNNRFYETTDFSPTESVEYAVIRHFAAGTGNRINNNAIGGNAYSPSLTNNKWVKSGTANNLFYGIYVRGSGPVPQQLSGQLYANTIHLFDWHNSGNASWTGIHADRYSSYSIGASGQGNVIGSLTETSSIILTQDITSISDFPDYTGFFGINYVSDYSIYMQYNAIGGITTATTDPQLSCNAFGIAKFLNGTYVPLYIRDNTISRITASSTSSGNPQYVYGVCFEREFSSVPPGLITAGHVSVSGNTIENLANNSTYLNGGSPSGSDGFGSRVHGIRIQAYFSEVYNNVIRELSTSSRNNNRGQNVSVAGISNRTLRYIYLNPDNYNEDPPYDTISREGIRDNRIYNLSNNTTNSTAVFGIYYQGGAELGPNDFNQVTRNFIENITVGTSPASIASQIAGIRIISGPATYSNNIISLGHNLTSQRAAIHGFLETGSTNQHARFYFNTVFVGGIAASSINESSYAFVSSSNNNIKNIRNNIFHNVRTGGNSNYHVAISLPNNNNLTIDWNNYYVAGSALGLFGGAPRATLEDWRLATLQDDNSVRENSFFPAIGIGDPVSYVPANPQTGVTGTGILVDFSNAPRDCNNSMGAWETQMISVLATAGVTNGTYRTLGEAFSRINDGTHQGDIRIFVNCDTYEPVTAVLYQSGYNGTSDYNFVRVFPSQPDIRIYGNLNGPVIEFDGANNVTFNGSEDDIGTNRDLTIENTLIANQLSVIQLTNGASNNNIQNCIIKGAPGLSSYALINITGSAANNLNNVISNNEFTGTGNGRPTNVIRVAGSSGAPLIYHTGTITNNKFYNYHNYSRGGLSAGILLDNGASAWTINGNSFYEKDAVNSTNTAELNAIRINTSLNTGTDFIITGNFIGGSDSLAVGTWTKTGNNNRFVAIYLSNRNIATNTSRITGNVIRGFNWMNSGNANWTAIHVERGQANIGGPNPGDGNIIGSSIAPPTPEQASIRVTGGASGAMFYGINDASTAISSARLIQRNTIGSVSTYNSVTTASFGFAGIAKTSAVGPVNVSRDTIVNIRALSPSTSNDQHVYGIWYGNFSDGIVTIENDTISGLYNGSGTSGINSSRLQAIRVEASNTLNIRNNSVHNLVSAFGNSTPNSGNASSVAGIVAAAGAQLDISSNRIYNLSNTFLTGGLQVTGISVSGPLNNPGSVFRNFLHSLSVASHNAGAQVYGIRINSGRLMNVFNNIVSLTTSVPTARTMVGIYDLGEVVNDETRLYYNTVYIGGEANISSGVSNNSYALWSNGGLNIKNYRNNIFCNARTNIAGTGRQTAIFFTNQPTGGLTLDYNNYVASGSGGVLGHLAGADFFNLPAWQTATTQDVHSLSVDPVFVAPGGTLANNYIPSAAMPGLNGLGGITDDFGTDAVRTDPVTMGAWENDCNGLVDDEPDAVTECENATVTFTIGVINVTTPVYQWQVSTDGGLTWTDLTETPPHSGTNSPVLTITGITITMNGNLFRCRVTDADNSCVVISTGALLTVNPRPTTSAIWHQ
jgi:hypothetical protein